MTHPQVEISTDLIRAQIYLPDAEKGYYRGTRFDWSGIIGSLEHDRQEYFGPWFECHDPRKHDAVLGPAEEFSFENGGLGYGEAPSGGTFIRIGVGVLRKPDEAAYRPFGSYDVVDPGRWTVRKGADWVEFNHEVENRSGHAYAYRKTVRLAKDRPALWLEHRLRNTGYWPLETRPYNHNFFTMGRRAMGPEVEVAFPFEPHPVEGLKGLMAVRGRRLGYLAEMQQGLSVLTWLRGFSPDASDHDITIEDGRTGAAVKICGDRPLSDLRFWSIRTVVCPEPYVVIGVPPGGETVWKTEYTFSTL